MSSEQSTGIPPRSLQSGFEKIDTDLAMLLECFAEMLESLGLEDLARQVPWRAGEASANPAPSPMTGQVYSIAFQLLNMVEENAAAEFRRRREAEFGPQKERGLWGNCLSQMLGAGATKENLEAVLRGVRVEPVLTAHPTEAKSLSVLTQHRTIFQLIERLNTPPVGAGRERWRKEVLAAMERLWRTGETPAKRPTVADERRNLLYYLTEVFPAVLTQLDERTIAAFEAAGICFSDLARGDALPGLRFGTWVGGDRDGHPFVTAEVTRETLHSLRSHALRILREQLQDLESKLTLAAWMQPAPEGLLRHFEAAVPSDHPEPWRAFVGEMLRRLPEETGITHEGIYTNPSSLETDLVLLASSLEEVGADRLARNDVRPVLRMVRVFGFHLATLDIRQNSRFHRSALAQLMNSAGLPGNEFLNVWDEARRREFLEKELQSPRPFLPPGQSSGGPESEAVLSCYAVLREKILNTGTDGLGALIVSMTTGVSDLLTVYLLAREAGLCRFDKQGLACALPVVPLFETLSDLADSGGILEDFLAHPITKATLAWRKERENDSAPLEQQVMVGYSDSCKDAGILASQWGLHQAQRDLTRVAEKHGARICFFHGRGGTVSRGAGPTHRFLEALAPGSLSGPVRLTEQGETVAQKYANSETAVYNLELLLAGVTTTTWNHSRQKECDGVSLEQRELMDSLATQSQLAYREFLREPGFMEFYRAATPIDALELCQIGSRPSRRTGTNSLEDLRAIPWVFSWNQSRFYLPGWFGVGTALAHLEPARLDLLGDMVRSWPFANYAFTNIESSVASSDADLMTLYSSLVGDESLRSRFLGLVLAERERTQNLLEKIYGSQLASRRPRMAKTLALRAGALRSLHFQQVDLLREWREKKLRDPSASETLPPHLRLSINAIASGLRTTG